MLFRRASALLLLFAAPLFSAADDYFIPPSHLKHWAWRRSMPQPPAVKNGSAANNAIDLFILARLEAVGLALAPPMTREGLRCCFNISQDSCLTFTIKAHRL